VISLDRRVIGDGKPGPLTKRFIAAFKELASTTGTPID
jgi:branched-chain amino acid aminotransferase